VDARNASTAAHGRAERQIKLAKCVLDKQAQFACVDASTHFSTRLPISAPPPKKTGPMATRGLTLPNI
jgi:hypothetical protein